MSQIELKTGTVTPISTNIEEWAASKGVELPENTTWENFLEEEYYGQYYLDDDGTIYRIDSVNHDYDLFKGYKVGDQFHFVCSYYNGGLGFYEALKKCLDSAS